MTDTTLAILAGGEGSRMGGPKGHLRVGDVPILEFLLNRFAWDGPTLLVTAPGREHPPGHERFDVEAVDPVAGLGPLRGVLTALEHATTDRAVITTVDMPGVSRAQFDWLREQHQGRPNAHTLLIETVTGDAPATEPFPSLWRRSAVPFIRARLDAHRRSVSGMLGQPDFIKLHAPAAWDATVWTNLNHPADLTAFQNGRPRT